VVFLSFNLFILIKCTTESSVDNVVKSSVITSLFNVGLSSFFKSFNPITFKLPYSINCHHHFLFVFDVDYLLDEVESTKRKGEELLLIFTTIFVFTCCTMLYVQASSLPMSIIIVGIGNAEFDGLYLHYVNMNIT